MLCFVCACLPTAGPALECLRTTAAVLALGPAAAGPARLLPRQDAPRLHGAVPGQAAGGLQGMRRGLREAVPGPALRTRGGGRGALAASVAAAADKTILLHDAKTHTHTSLSPSRGAVQEHASPNRSTARSCTALAGGLPCGLPRGLPCDQKSLAFLRRLTCGSAAASERPKGDKAVGNGVEMHHPQEERERVAKLHCWYLLCRPRARQSRRGGVSAGGCCCHSCHSCHKLPQVAHSCHTPSSSRPALRNQPGPSRVPAGTKSYKELQRVSTQRQSYTELHIVGDTTRGRRNECLSL